MKIAILVTHLLGAGHLTRAVTLARAFAGAGWRASVLSGGKPAAHIAADGVELIQLPPLSSDGTEFRRLMTPEGAEADENYMAARREAQIAALARSAPDVVITELFPFGRRVLASEFEAALTAQSARADRPLIFASVRDILAAPSKPKRVAETEARLQRFYDGVLVHADPSVIELEASWPVTAAIRAMLRYTGFVAPPSGADLEPEGSDGAGEVIVAAGGGPVGDLLFETAIAAAKSLDGETSARRWRLVVGGGEARMSRLRDLSAGSNAIVEPARRDYRALLRRAAVSVSQCGYNTALDLLSTGAPAVLVPFEEGGETEQRLRAETLSHRFGYPVLSEAELTPESLREAVEKAIAAGGAKDAGFRLDGAAETVRIVTEALEARA